ncbi:hypothetical protein LCGC14_0385910 [marine sediment metagenome]|uniref:Uncharacterized protein n=1 Tax=marine sediment metagenome TaxID=412755 RepID=A0A0F9TIZ4_9ZZZZ
MPYKDPAKQREAVCQAVAKHRGKGITEAPQGITQTGKDVIPDVIPVRPANQIIHHNPPLAADVVANFKPEPRTSGYARFGPQRPLKASETALVSPSIPEHKRRRGGLKMGFEPWRVHEGPTPELDADGNVIPEGD